MSHRLLLSSIQLSPKASEYKPGAPPPYPSSIQHSWSPALLNSFSEASNTSLKKSIYSPCPSTRCKVYDVWLRTELHKQLLRKWVEGWMKDEWMKEGLKITVGKSLPSEIPSWQHGSQQQTDHGGFRNDPLSPIPLPAFVRFPASFCPQWGPCVFLLSVFFPPTRWRCVSLWDCRTPTGSLVCYYARGISSEPQYGICCLQDPKRLNKTRASF